jgi:glycosyltransferase involved in cell wall biosynthesis
MTHERGISFLIRVRNEEKNIYAAINCLLQLTIPIEIIVILHCCTDASESIVRSFNDNRIHVYTYSMKISRAGYETLATDANSPHSIVSYDNWCFAKANMPWVFKWDADFIATPDLIHYLESRTWEYNLEKISFIATNSTHNNREDYLACGQLGYKKSVFWEVPFYCKDVVRTVTNISIHHNSELSDLKEYWNEPSWYLNSDNSDALLVKLRMELLINEFGPEPKGGARASNPECNYERIMNTYPLYVNLYS